MHPYIDLANVSKALDEAMTQALEHLQGWPENRLGACFVWDYNGQIGWGEELPVMPGAIVHMALATAGYEDVAAGLVSDYEDA